jgi:hypothetical protein
LEPMKPAPPVTSIFMEGVPSGRGYCLLSLLRRRQRDKSVINRRIASDAATPEMVPA